MNANLKLNRARILCFCVISCLAVGLRRTPIAVSAERDPDQRPNIVLVLVDDLGYSDIGCYGSEIETPHLDRLAKNGIRFTQFYNCAKCETTRATLLSGRYHPEVKTRKLENCVTLAEAMKLAGYHTMMTGKWHMESDPVERGFDRFFGHLSGATNFFVGDATFRLNREVFRIRDKDFYTTDANTDYAIRFLDEWKRENKTRDRPFFLYIAHNAPHYPLQCRQRDFEKYRGKYRQGWDQLRRDRMERQKKLGLVDGTLELPARPANAAAWDTLNQSEQDIQDLTMAAYAGMIDCIDQNIGRLIKQLKSMGELDNTLILFLSDNGACPFQRTRKETREKKLMPYDSKSYWTYDQGWAHACNTPLREYKQNQHEGGICTPMIAHWPAGIVSPGTITHQPGHLVDIMTTMLELSKAEYPREYRGKPVGPARGLSLLPIFAGQQRKPHEYLFFSFRGKNNAIRIGDWKLVNKNHQAFELYHLSKDRNERNNLAEKNPEKLKEMKTRIAEIFKEVGAPIKPPPGSRKRKKRP